MGLYNRQRRRHRMQECGRGRRVHFYSVPQSFASTVYVRHVRPSVCPSVTLRCCVKTRERRVMRSSPSGSLLSLVSHTKNGWWGRPSPDKNSRAVHMSLHNSGTVIDIEKSSINANRKSTIGFPTSHQSRSCVTPNFLKMGFKYPHLSFFAQILTKNH